MDTRYDRWKAWSYTYKYVILAFVTITFGLGLFAVLGRSTKCGRYESSSSCRQFLKSLDATRTSTSITFPLAAIRGPGSRVTLDAATALHSLPQGSSPPVGDKIRAGSSVQYDCTTADTHWLRISYRTASGWVPAGNIRESLVSIPCTQLPPNH